MFTTSDPVAALILALAVVGYMVYRLFAQRVVTQRDLLLPLIGALYLGYKDVDWSNLTVALAVVGGALLGILVGAVSGQLVRVWRGADGRVYQRGSWGYAAVLVGLLALRAALYIAVVRGRHGPAAAALGDASLALALGLYLGRTVSVGARALALVGWQLEALRDPAVPTSRLSR